MTDLSPRAALTLDACREPGATINDVLDRIGGDPKGAALTVRQLVAKGLLVANGRRMTSGRPVVYRQTERGMAEWKESLR